MSMFCSFQGNTFAPKFFMYSKMIIAVDLASNLLIKQTENFLHVLHEKSLYKNKNKFMQLNKLLKNIHPFVYPYRWIIVVTLFLTAISSFVGQVNALVVKYTVDSVNGLVVNHQGIKEGIPILTFVLIAFLGKEVLNVSIQLAQQFYGEKLRVYLSKDLSQAAIEKILTYRLAFFTASSNGSGKLQTRIDRGVESLTRLVQIFFIDILPLFATAIVALIMMFHANIYVGFAGVLLIPLYFYISRRQAKKLKSSRKNIRTYYENKNQGLLSILESIPVIKSFIRENIEAKKQLELQNLLTENKMRSRKLKTLYEASKGILEQISLTVIVLLTVYFILKGQMTIGMIVFNIMLFGNVSAPVRRFHQIYDEVNDAVIYSDGFFDVLNADNEIEERGRIKPDSVVGRFKLTNVNFTYPNNTQALFDVNIDILPGKVTALVGLSGAGKSTVISLLEKFYEADSGEISLDGISLKNYDTSFLRENIGLVLQKNHIFNGSIEDNIRYGNPNATTEEIIEAAKKAYIHDQIMSMPKQYQTKALELSGGQQQRIAIARMFLKNPPIIFLDEPTASLDAVATEQIKNSIDAIKKGRTVIIISHSISQIIDADTIYVMEEGHVVENGTHEDVYKFNGSYTKIFDSMVRSLNMDKISKTINGLSVKPFL